MAFVAVNAEQSENWNGASGRHFIEQHERMRGGLTARWPGRRWPGSDNGVADSVGNIPLMLIDLTDRLIP